MPYDPDDESETPSRALRIKEEHEARLLAIDGVEGVGLGSDEAGEDAIILYLRNEEARARAPAKVEGVAVITEITGPIDAY